MTEGRRVGERERASGRLARSFLRYLRERVGDVAYEAIARELAPEGAALLRQPPDRHDWVPLAVWLPVLEAFERRFGDPATLQLVREATRATMAVAVEKAWAAFLADATPEALLQRAGTFWAMSYDTGTLVVAARGPRRWRLAIDGWEAPPPQVVASVAEACVVFLVRLGERAARAVDTLNGGRGEIEVSW